MPIWIVSGANSDTGEDESMRFEADDEFSARARAKRAGMLVAEVIVEAQRDETATLKSIEYARSLALKTSYPELESSSKAMGILAMIISGLGIVCLVGALFAIIFAIITYTTDRDSLKQNADLTQAACIILSCVASSIPFFVVASMLRFFSSAADALSDIARNSFRR